jgi:hypothetical protein
MTEPDVHGPVDFVLIEFPEDRLTGRAAQELLELVDRGIVRVFDVLIVGKDETGATYGLELAEAPVEQVGGFSELAWARSGLLTDEDLHEAAKGMEPGRLAALIVYENTWAIPFVTAARASGGELVASARLSAQDVMDALAAAESQDNLQTTS